MTDQEYYTDTSRVTNTMLGWTMSGPRYLKYRLDTIDNYDDERVPDYLIFGQAVHCRLLERHEFGIRYYVSRYKGPSNAVQKKFCELLIHHKKVDKKAITTAYKMSYSVGKTSNDIIYDKGKALYDSYRSHIKEKRENQNKHELSEYDYNRIIAMEHNVRAHPRANDIIFGPYTALNEQVIKFEMEVPCKSKLDRVIILPDDKTIVLVDVKTHTVFNEQSNFKQSFSKSFQNFDYDRQLWFYLQALKSMVAEKFNDDPANWTFEAKIVAIKSNYDNEVRVFNVSVEDLKKTGRPKYQQAIDRFLWYKQHGYTLPYETNAHGEENLVYE